MVFARSEMRSEGAIFVSTGPDGDFQLSPPRLAREVFLDPLLAEAIVYSYFSGEFSGEFNGNKYLLSVKEDGSLGFTIYYQ